jgi:hypothetical protein
MMMPSLIHIRFIAAYAVDEAGEVEKKFYQLSSDC